MNYARIYSEFIENRREKELGLTGYVEVHHIRPRCMGGGDEDENLIRLTAEDHFFAHILLAKAHGGPLWSALSMMCVGRRKAGEGYLRRMRRLVARARERAARHHSKLMKGRFTGDKHPMYGRPCSELAKAKTREMHAAGRGPMSSPAARRKLSKTLKGRVFSEEHRRNIAKTKTGQRRSLESRRKQSASMMGRKQSPEAIAKTRAAHLGRKRSPEQIEKMRAANLGKRLSQETKEKISARWREHGHPKGMLGKSHSDAYKEMMSRFNSAKRAYAHRFGVPCRTVTKAMLESAGMGVG